MHKRKMVSPWIKHVAAFRKAHPGMDNKKVFGEAAKTFKKQKQSGGDALGGSLSPSGVPSGGSTSGTALQVQATTFSGGKKSKRRGSKSKRSGSKRSGSKSKRRGSKRRH
jgi:hypothetical protein